MSWLDIDLQQKNPSDANIDRLWRSVSLRAIESTPADIETYLAELRRVNANGGGAFAWYEVAANRDFDWFATRNLWHDMRFFERFLTHAVVRQQWPEVTRAARFDDAVVFEWQSSFLLDSDLAQTLVTGGAYRSFDGSPAEAKQLGTRACGALFDDRFTDVEVFHSWRRWSAWFHDVAWDQTWVIIDRRVQRVALLVATDTD